MFLGILPRSMVGPSREAESKNLILGGPEEKCAHAMSTCNLKIVGDNVRPVYTVPHDDVANELLIPAMAAADDVRCMAGFFSSKSLALLAPGLASFINGSNGTISLLVSPKLDHAHRNAITSVAAGSEAALRILMPIFSNTVEIEQSSIVRHALACFAYLLASRRLVLRVVLMPQGMLHAKVWIFRDGDKSLVVHGSSNPTEPGLIYNIEHLNVERSWIETSRVDYYQKMFDVYWYGESASALTLDVVQAAQLFSRFLPESTPTIEDYWSAWEQDVRDGLVPQHGVRNLTKNTIINRLKIPSSLKWSSGPFAHQGKAVEAWENSKGRGIVAVATGGGKTIIALIIAARLQDRVGRLLLVVSAPYKPLLEQWNSEIRQFGLVPLQINEVAAPFRIRRMEESAENLRRGLSFCEAIVTSNDMLKSEGFRTYLNELPREIQTLLVSDEVHNLGTSTFLSDPPDRFDFRLGLSATYIRQYDPEGTGGLLKFFGDVVFEFSLEDAIRVGCLCRYNYYLHEVRLTFEESDEWERITYLLLSKNFLQFSDDVGQSIPDYIRLLLIKRRAVIENAQEKVTTLRKLLENLPRKELTHTLIYTSAKETHGVKQIVQVNRLLNELGLDSHQLTSAETSSGESTEILSAFSRGIYQVLTAMKVLDEGVNIPEAHTAYLLASSTVVREWVQRRGRILRNAPGKGLAHIHDFIAIPPDLATASGRDMLRGEILRAQEFAKLSENSTETWEILQKYSV